MISGDEAITRILAAVEPLEAESVQLLDARGRYAAADIRSPSDLPRFDQSSMDGYAVRACDSTPGACLEVIGEQPAGPDRKLSLAPGAAIRIFTGAAIPFGADAVVMQEDVEWNGSAVTIREGAAPGEFVRRRGSDLCSGQIVLRAGDAINAQRIGLLATLGIETVSTHRPPRIALIGSGDELRPPGTPLAPGEIYESNTLMLQALLGSHGFRISSRVTTPDDRAAIASTFAAASDADAVIFSGGVSVGDHDHVPAILRENGAEIDFWRVAVRPGKPFLFGTRGRLMIFGLPGNPVSTFVSAMLFALPALRRLAGAPPARAIPQQVEARLAGSAENPGDRPHYVRGNLDGGSFMPSRLQESHALGSLAESNALGLLPPRTHLAPGSSVVVLPLE